MLTVAVSFAFSAFYLAFSVFSSYIVYANVQYSIFFFLSTASTVHCAPMPNVKKRYADIELYNIILSVCGASHVLTIHKTYVTCLITSSPYMYEYTRMHAIRKYKFPNHKLKHISP